MMITITTIAANESVNAGKRVVEIDGETLGVFTTVLDAFDAVDAWARAALGFGVKAWDDYYTVPTGRPGMSETLAVYLHSLADVAYELDVTVSELDTAHLASGVAYVSASHAIEMANSLLNRQVAHSLEVSAGYRVATTIVATETGLLVTLLGDAPVEAVRTLMGIMPDLVAYVWSDCDRVEVAYVPTTGMFTTVSASFKS